MIAVMSPVSRWCLTVLLCRAERSVDGHERRLRHRRHHEHHRAAASGLAGRGKHWQVTACSSSLFYRRSGASLRLTYVSDLCVGRWCATAVALAWDTRVIVVDDPDAVVASSSASVSSQSTANASAASTGAQSATQRQQRQTGRSVEMTTRREKVRATPTTNTNTTTTTIVWDRNRCWRRGAGVAIPTAGGVPSL